MFYVLWVSSAALRAFICCMRALKYCGLGLFLSSPFIFWMDVIYSRFLDLWYTKKEDYDGKYRFEETEC